MTEFQAFILGIIQGLTEFLPISSTGHLLLGRKFFGLNEAGLFLDTMLHLGTLLAVVVIYRSELFYLIKNPTSKLMKLLVIGSIPAVIAALLFEDLLESLSNSGVTVGWEFIITGFILFFSDTIKQGAKKVEEITYKDAAFIGSFQAFAILPAISRSGLTIAAGIFSGLDRSTAAYFSFLLSIPVIAGGVLFQLKDVVSGQVEAIPLISLFTAIVTSAIFGYIAIIGMFNYLKKHSLKLFACYVWILGFVIIILQLSGSF